MQTTASEIEIRPLVPTDRGGLATAFARLTNDTRWRRFRGIARRLGDRDLDRLTRIDHHDHDALAAIAADSGQAEERRAA